MVVPLKFEKFHIPSHENYTHSYIIQVLVTDSYIIPRSVADLEGGVRGVRGVRPPKIRKAYVIQR
jgi:hypothetical protein